ILCTMRVARAQNAQTNSVLAPAECAQKHVAFGNGRMSSIEFVAHALDEIAGGDLLIATGPEFCGDLSEQHVYARRLGGVGRRRRGPNLFEVWGPKMELVWRRRWRLVGERLKYPHHAHFELKILHRHQRRGHGWRIGSPV